MKKIYFSPEVETIDVELLSMLCGSDTGTDGGSDDGGTDVTPTDPSDPEWGSDY